MKYKFYGAFYDFIHFILPNIDDIIKTNDILSTSQQYKNIINCYNSKLPVELSSYDGTDIMTLYEKFNNTTIKHQLTTISQVSQLNQPFVLIDNVEVKKIGHYISHTIQYFNKLDYVSNIQLLQECETFITSNPIHKDFALNTKCKKVILITNNILDTYNYEYNPFNTELCITDTLTPIKLKFYFYPESIKSILYNNYKNCPYDKTIKLISKNKLMDEINNITNNDNDDYSLIINTNYTHCEKFYDELINKFCK